MRCAIVVLALLLTLGAVTADEPLWLSAHGTQPPRIYLFWQSGWIPKQRPEDVELVSPVPPDLFQYATTENLLRGLPHESMCPAPAEFELHWSHEQATEQVAAQPRWWTTDEYQARIDRAAEEVAWVQEQTGAYGVLPYICAKKLQGEHEKRMRFYAFYDHWDQYERWYGPKPAVDPWEWIEFRFDYQMKSLWAFYQPQPDGSVIRSACPNSPFSDFLADFTRIGAGYGLPGVYVDNPGTQCVCERYCVPAWHEYLGEHYSPAELTRYYGSDDPAQIDLQDPTLEVERKRFWGWSAGRHLARLREASEEVSGDVGWVCPNGAMIEFAPANYGCDLASWAEVGAAQLLSRECNRMIEGVEHDRLTDRLWFNGTDDLILGHKMARGCPSFAMWSAPLRSHVFLGEQPAYYDLAAAETLAFDGVFLDCGAPWFPTEARAPFHAFYRPLESLLRSGPSVAEVGVLTFSRELLSDPADSVREVRLVTDWLSEAHVLWDALTDDAFAQRDLSGYRAIFVPNVRMMDDDEVAALTDYARAGGRLVISGDCATRFACGVERKGFAWRALPVGEPDESGCAIVDAGEGRVLWAPRLADIDLRVPYTGSDVECAQPARGLIRETNREAFWSYVNRLVGADLSAVAAPGPRNLRVAARWFEDDGEATMTVHLANYDLNVHSGRKKYYRVPRADAERTPAEEVRLSVPVPAGYLAIGVRWAAMPDPTLRELPFEALAAGVSFTVPRVNAYAVAAVTLQPGDGAGRSLADARGDATSAEGALPAVEVTGDAQPILYAAEATGEFGFDEVLHVTPGQPVIVSGEAGGELQIRIDRPGQERIDPIVWQPMRAFDAAAEGEKGQVRWLRFWLIAPSGATAASGAVPAEQSTLLRVPAEETGLYALMTEAGPGALAVSTTSRALMTTAQPFVSEQPNERLSFLVPNGLESVTLSTWGADSTMHFEVLDADGQPRFERADFNFITVEDEVAVPAEQAGRVWSMTFETGLPMEKRAGRRTNIELQPPLSGFVAPDPARLAVIGAE